MAQGGKAIIKQLCAQHGLKCGPTLIKKVTDEIEEARIANQNNKKPGLVRVGQTWRGQKKEHIPFFPTFLSIYISKGKGEIGNATSPFVVKCPKDMIQGWTKSGEEGEGGELAGCGGGNNNPPLELVWQGAKVLEKEVVREKGEGKGKKAGKQYFGRREKIYRDKVPKRRYFEKGEAVAGALFGNNLKGTEEEVKGGGRIGGGRLFQWVDSRWFYCVAYERALALSPVFLLLKGLVEEGFNILLLGPDGFPISEEEEEKKGKEKSISSFFPSSSPSPSSSSTSPTTPHSNPPVSASLTPTYQHNIRNAYYSTAHPFGHERVLLSLLMEYKPWLEQLEKFQNEGKIAKDITLVPVGGGGGEATRKRKIEEEGVEERGKKKKKEE